jgi:hypothetical protein
MAKGGEEGRCQQQWLGGLVQARGKQWWERLAVHDELSRGSRSRAYLAHIMQGHGWPGALPELDTELHPRLIRGRRGVRCDE